MCSLLFIHDYKGQAQKHFNSPELPHKVPSFACVCLLLFTCVSVSLLFISKTGTVTYIYICISHIYLCVMCYSSDITKTWLAPSRQVTTMLKCGNYKVFGKDLEHHLADLEHTLGGYNVPYNNELKHFLVHAINSRLGVVSKWSNIFPFQTY